MTPDETLLSAARNGDLESARKAIEAGANINYGAGKQCTPLHLAAAYGHLALATILIENGASTDALDDLGNTPLHHCFVGGDHRFAVAKFLVDSGAGVNIPDEDNVTPLHLAAACGSLSLVMLLDKKGANVNCLDWVGRTPLDLAKDNGHPRVAAWLQKMSEKGSAQSKNFDK